LRYRAKRFELELSEVQVDWSTLLLKQLPDDSSGHVCGIAQCPSSSSKSNSSLCGRLCRRILFDDTQRYAQQLFSCEPELFVDEYDQQFAKIISKSRYIYHAVTLLSLYFQYFDEVNSVIASIL
jgi:hypothetical protein